MTSYEDYRKALIQQEINKSASKQLKQKINKKKLELSNLKFRRYERTAEKIEKGLSKVLPKKLTNKRILRDKQRVTVDVSQPVYTKDKSRYFKTAWEEEKKQLFFK